LRNPPFELFDGFSGCAHEFLNREIALGDFLSGRCVGCFDGRCGSAHLLGRLAVIQQAAAGSLTTRALSILPETSAEIRFFTVPHPPEFRVGQFAQRLHGGYIAHHAAMTIANDPRAAALVPPVEVGQNVPVGRIPYPDRDDQLTYHFTSAPQEATMPGAADEYARSWLSGALITLGDALARHEYFDRAPILEMVRHLRNAVAHGNRFEIRDPTRLDRFPAHTRDASPNPARPDRPPLEVTVDLDGSTLLFDYMIDLEVVTLFQSVGNHLLMLAAALPRVHDPPRRLAPPTSDLAPVILIEWIDPIEPTQAQHRVLCGQIAAIARERPLEVDQHHVDRSIRVTLDLPGERHQWFIQTDGANEHFLLRAGWSPVSAHGT
jgi:hypothetical protein